MAFCGTDHHRAESFMSVCLCGANVQKLSRKVVRWFLLVWFFGCMCCCDFAQYPSKT